jgi:hypothetical protein
MNCCYSSEQPISALSEIINKENHLGKTETLETVYRVIHANDDMSTKHLMHNDTRNIVPTYTLIYSMNAEFYLLRELILFHL